MKLSYLFTAAVVLFGTNILVAQSEVGSWSWEVTQQGQTVNNIISFAEDGSFTVDLGGDGNTDMVGDYTMDGDQMTISDTMENSPCSGKPGVYTIKVEGDMMTVTMVSEECEARRSDGPILMTRVE